jgi:threonine-phosphate decarboxylase
MVPAVSVTHGSVTDRELAALGLERADVLDLSSNLHPAGPDPRVLDAMRAADIGLYPEPDGEPLRAALARLEGLTTDEVLVTPGATAAIHLALRVTVEPGASCALFPPTFGEYEAAARLAGATIREQATEGPAFELPDRVAPASIGVLCNPNNPTGVYLTRAEVERVVDGLGGALVLDVAYDAFVEDPWDADQLHRDGLPVVVIHSLTKLHAIPGLRLGYVTGAPELIARLGAAQPSWSVGAPAIAAGLAAVELDAERRLATGEARRALEVLRDALEQSGVSCAPSRANFLLAEVGDGAAVRSELIAEAGIVVRDCASFGLPGWIRVAAPSPAEIERVSRALVSAVGTRQSAGAAS